MAKKQKQSPEEILAAIAALVAPYAAAPDAEDKAADTDNDEAADGEVELPDTIDGIKELSEEDASSLASSLGLETEGLNAKQITGLLVSVFKVTNDEDLTEKEANNLAKAVGEKPAKSVEKTVARLKEFFVADEAESDEEDASSDEEESDEEESDEEESSDDDESEDEEESDEEESEDEESDEEESDEEESDEEESDDEENDEEESDDEEESEDEESDDDEDESDEEETEEESDEEESEEESDEPSDKEKIAAYNKVAKKKIKDIDALNKLLTDDENEVAAWGVPYSKDENVFCCGMPLKDAKIKKGKKTVDGGICVVTGKKFVQDEDGNFEEVE